MKKYVVLDQTKDDWFELNIKSESVEDAILETEAMWKHLSEYDKKKTTYFALVIGEVDDEGLFDYEAGWDEIKVFNK